MGHRQPPPLAWGATDPVVRIRATHRSNVRWSRSNNAAIAAYEPSPRSYAATARFRNATSYAFAMASVKYTSAGNSSAVRD